MEWLILLVFFWSQISSFLGFTDKEDEDELEENEDDLETDDKEVKKIKEDPRTMPTITRVSKTDLRTKPVNRPTVINRRK